MDALNNKTLEQLQKNIESDYRDSLSLIMELKDGNIKPDGIAKLANLVSEEFAKRGLDKEDEPTEYGLQLESLLDKLSNLDE